MRLWLLAALLPGTLPLAASVYRIEFDGAISQGTLSSTRIGSGSLTPFDVRGSTLRGSVDVDLSLAPSPTDTPGAGTFSRVFSDVDGLNWLTAQIEFNVPALPADFLPAPTTLSIGPATTGPGFVPISVFPSVRSLAANSSDTCCDLLTVNASFGTDGVEAGRLTTAISSFNLTLFPILQFLPASPPFPATFMTGPSVLTSSLHFIGADVDGSGIHQFFSYEIEFNIESTRATVLETAIPEPASVLLCGLALSLALAGRHFVGNRKER